MKKAYHLQYFDHLIDVIKLLLFRRRPRLPEESTKIERFSYS